ncbi:hypothetical protein SO802_012639 [Lithocarpus litseifolius]|uniref:Glutamate decarboxylase n=1 Tax=Lithocarpus litseifolius TaxID=425828 RepID=A0AAW2D5V6_9ROSI
MVLSRPASESDLSVLATSASRYVRDSLPRYKMPESSIPKEAAYQIIHDELLLDCKPKLNLASFVTTLMEPECDKLVMESINKNYVDMDEYPVTTELHNRCVNMIARLFHTPLGESEDAIGVGTVGSSEAIMLAGLAFKRKWQNKRKVEGKPFDKPNIVTGANVQVCWEKFARYFEVELKEVNVREGYYVMDPAKAVEMVDENTICVAAILGSTYNGEFEDVKLLNDLLLEKNKQTGWDTPIHVDAASGGFIAPFIYPELEWDFRLPLVKSINVSGHKYGLVYAGIGWNIWRSKDDLPEELIFHIKYLGAEQSTFTLNFSKGSSQIIAQYYQLIRLGQEGYKNIMENCHENAMVLKEGLEKTGRFEILSKDDGVPVVAFSLKNKKGGHDEFVVSEMLRRFGWIVPAYPMPAGAQHVIVLRVVIRAEFSRTLAERLVHDITTVLHELDKLPPKVTSEVEENGNNGLVSKRKSDLETQREVTTLWKNYVIAQKEIRRQKVQHVYPPMNISVPPCPSIRLANLLANEEIARAQIGHVVSGTLGIYFDFIQTQLQGYLAGSQSLKNIDINVYYGRPLVNPEEIDGFHFKGQLYVSSESLVEVDAEEVQQKTTSLQFTALDDGCTTMGGYTLLPQDHAANTGETLQPQEIREEDKDKDHAVNNGKNLNDMDEYEERIERGGFDRDVDDH